MMRRSTLWLFFLAAAASGRPGGQLRSCLRAEPKTFKPILVDDQYSETIRYLTGSALIRVNRLTQELEPEMAKSWKIQPGGRRFVFQLRRGLLFSNGTPFSAGNVAYTMRTLLDPNLHPTSGDSRVEFSVIANAGNKARRISRTSDYEACLLGFSSDDPDPNAQRNVWLSSASNNQWNPDQKSSQTAWEGEIDRLMRAQASAADPKRRKASFDRVQEIVREEEPFRYMVYRNSLSAVSPAVHYASSAALRPQAYWNAEWLSLTPELAGSRS